MALKTVACEKLAALSHKLCKGEPLAVWGVTAAVFALSFYFFFSIYSSLFLLYDTDSYFHLAVAREYGQRGIPYSLRWARFSIMHEGYGDKEFLFHVLLVPLAGWMDPELGGKLGLSLLNAFIAASIANLSIRAVGLAGLLAPVLTFCLSGTFVLRMIRLRPELLALVLLLWAAWAASRRRWLALGALAFLYALSYTAFHALLLLCAAWFVWDAWTDGKWQWRLPVFATAGAVLGLAVNPHFPANLKVWILQNIDFFRFKQVLDVGAEFNPYTTAQLFELDGGFFAALLALWWSRSPRPDADEQAQTGVHPARTAAYFCLSALPFAFLFVLMSRFATFFVPFVTLTLLWEIRRRGFGIGFVTHLPGGQRVRFLVVLSACMLGSLSVGRQVFLVFATNGGLLDTARNNLKDMSRTIPPGARIAAPWDMTGDYVFWAPRADYLNILDPVFMAVTDPYRYRIQSELFAGVTPDVPLAVKVDLQSDYLAFPGRRLGQLQERLLNDPRAEYLVKGQQVLYRIRDDANHAFVLDWKATTSPPEGGPGKELLYPRHSAPEGRRVEGFVDATRIAGARPCAFFVHNFELRDPTVLIYEFAPLGLSALWIDGIQRVKTASPANAVLGKGIGVPVRLGAGGHSVAVRTCYQGTRSGFYLLRRDQSR